MSWSVTCGGDSDVTASDFEGFGGECPSGTVMIGSDESSAMFEVPTNDDSVVEGMETFSVILSSSVSPNIDGRITILDTMRAASVTIGDNDIDETGRVELSLSAPPSVVSEGIPEGGSVTFTVLLENGVTVGEEITVEWGVLCSSDITPDDFDFVGEDCPSGTLMIPADTTFAEFTVSVRADMVAEGDENFEVRLRNPMVASDNFTVFVVESS